MRLIDADAIPWDVDGVGFIPVIGKDEIDAMPEGVVRCKDCKWYNPKGGDPFWCDNDDGIWSANPESYCSLGERREDAEE